MNETKDINELITNFAKKGFLLDRESVDFFSRLDDNKIAEDALNRIFTLSKARIISRKTMTEHFNDIKLLFSSLNPEKAQMMNDFFSGAVLLKQQDSKEKKEEIQKQQDSDLKIINSTIIPYRRIEVKDFVTHFKNRYNFFKDLLRERKELANLVSINKIGNNRSFSIIGLVSQKRVTKNKNIIIEVEDLTGKTNVLVNHEKGELMKKAQETMLDDVIGLKCSGNGDLLYVNDIFFPDCGVGEKRKLEEEAYALFVSDGHCGSKLFLEQNFLKFLKWLNGEDSDEQTKEKIKKIKYLFFVGDNVDGVGVYPGQESLLIVKDIKEQYKKLAEYLKMIPKHIKIIICPGQHDAVRVPEPQPAIDEEFAEEITKMPNVYLVSNPAVVEIGCTPRKNGFKVLMYHGASMHDWIGCIDDLRLGQANLNPSKVVKYMLKHRHLSPTHSANAYVPSEKEDSLMIKEIPDIIVTGDMHRTDIDIYNNILIICSSCWQTITPFEEKVGNVPDPCKVPMLNLKTREIKILDFT